MRNVNRKTKVKKGKHVKVKRKPLSNLNLMTLFRSKRLGKARSSRLDDAGSQGLDEFQVSRIGRLGLKDWTTGVGVLRLLAWIFLAFRWFGIFVANVGLIKGYREEKKIVELIFITITILFSLFGFVLIQSDFASDVQLSEAQLVSYNGDVSNVITGFASFEIYPSEPPASSDNSSNLEIQPLDPSQEVSEPVGSDNETFTLPTEEPAAQGSIGTNSSDEQVDNSVILINETNNFLIQPFDFGILAAPTQGTPDLYSTNNATNGTDQNLTCYNQSTADTDGDTVKNIYNWYRNNVSIMVLNMPFEGGSNSTYTKDYSSRENTGTVAGATYNATGGQDGFGAYSFDGVNDYINISDANSLDITGDMTIMAWVYFKALDTTNGDAIVAKWGGPTYSYLLFSSSASKPQFAIWDTAQRNCIGNTTLQSNTWYHIVGVRSGNNLYVYLNDTLDGTGTAVSATASTASKIEIGRAATTNLYVLNGTIDEVRIYNYTLSANQIKALYNNQTNLIHSDETTNGDFWKCSVTPNDGASDGSPLNSSELLILNFNPTTTLVSPTNANQTAGSINVEFNCSATSTTNLTNITLYSNWTGTWHANQTNTVSGTSNSTIFKANVTAKKWYLWNCLSYNTLAYSDFGDSNFTFFSNTPPTQDIPLLFSTNNATNDTNQNLTCYNQSTADADGDTVKNIYNWYRNNVSIMVFNAPFEANASGQNTTDYSGFNPAGAVSGAIFDSDGGYDGRGAYSFDGKNDYIDFGSGPRLKNFTLEVWIYPLGAGSAAGDCNIIGRTEDSPWRHNYWMALSKSGSTFTLSSGFYDGTTWVGCYDAWPMAANNWYHVVSTFNDANNNMSLFINGNITKSCTLSGSPNGAGTCKLGLGAGNAGTNTYINATMDEARIYNYSLSANQIKALYHNQTNLIHSDATSNGDFWKCEVTPNDGTSDGSSLNSSELEILANVAPTIFLIYPLNNTVVTTASANLTYNVTDANADTIDNCTLWLTSTNGTTLLNNQTDTTITQDINQTFNLSFVGGTYSWITECYDEQNAGANSTLYYFNITPSAGNTAPIVANITYEPSTVYGNTVLNCNISVYDLNGDTLTVYMNWTNGSTHYASYTKTSVSSVTKLNFTLAPEGIQYKSEIWNCSASVHDGTDRGAVNSTTVTISNTAPSIPNIYLNMSTAYTNSVIDCNATVYDVDYNDTLTIYMNWTNGTEHYAGYAKTGLSTGNVVNFTLAPGIQYKGETWNCTARVYDGVGLSIFNSTRNNITNYAPALSGLTWITTGGFTDNTLAYNQIMKEINITATDTDSNSDVSEVKLTVYDPDNSTLLNNLTMSSVVTTIWNNGTQFQFTKSGTWNISILASDGYDITRSSSTFIVSTNNLSLTDGWYGFTNNSILSSSEITELSGYGYDILEISQNETGLIGNWSAIRDSINNSYQQNIKSAINILLDVNISSSGNITKVQTDINSTINDTLLDPYSISIEYISLEIYNPDIYTDAVKYDALNKIAKTVTDAMDNKFTVYSKNYNHSSLDNAYLKYTSLKYIEPTTSPDFINQEAVLLRGNISLNRIYSKANSTIRSQIKTYQENIIDQIRGRINATTAIADDKVAEIIVNGTRDIVVFNNQSSARYMGVNVSEINATVHGKDVWDATNKLLIEADSDLNFSVNTSAYSATMIFFEDLDHIQLDSNTSAVLYKGGTSSTKSFNYTDETRDGSWSISGNNDVRIELFDPHYERNNFLVYYGWLNTSYMNTTNFQNYEIVILADKNQPELAKLNYTTTEFYSYIGVADYNSTDQVNWYNNKTAEVDAWLALNGSLHIFIDGLDTGIGGTNFSSRMKDLVDYVQITKSRKAILNTYTAYENFATWGTGGVMKESCVNRWNGVNSSSIGNYTRESWSLELNKSKWYQRHNVKVLCQAFSNITGGNLYYPYNYTELESIYFASKVLGYDYFFLSDPTFNYAPTEYVYDVGDDLAKGYSTTDNETYYRRYSKGIVYYNSSSGKGWIESGRTINKVEVCFELYDNSDAEGDSWNFVINKDGDSTQTGDYWVNDTSAPDWGWLWQCVTINATDYNNAHGRYIIEAWNMPRASANGFSLGYAIVPREDKHSWWDTSATDSWNAYSMGQNWHINISINESIKTSIDSLTSITQSASGDHQVKNITLSSVNTYNLSVWSSPVTDYNMDLRFFRIWNSTSFIDLNYTNTSDCTSNNPTWNTTTSAGRTYYACLYDDGGNITYRFAGPILSDLIAQTGSNNAPTIDTPTIYPATAYTNSILSCNTTAYDKDLDPITINFTWWNGTNVYISKSIVTTNGTITNYSLAEGIQAKNEVWNCSVRAFDGYENSTLEPSITRTITNTAPTTPTIGNPANASRQTGNSVTLNCGSSTDTDGDTINYEFYGAETTNPPTALLQNNTGITYVLVTGDGKIYWWRCRASDAEESSAYTTTKRFTENNLSIISNILIDPSVVNTDSTLNGSATIIDSDSDSLAVYMNWTNGSAHYISYLKESVSSGSVLNFTLIPRIQAKNEVWNFTTRVWDGYELSLFNSTTKTIPNTAPVVTLMIPDNETTNITHYTNFTYNVTDIDQIISNCSLWFDNNDTSSFIRNLTKLNPNLGATLNFTVNLTHGEHIWLVECADDENNKTNSSKFAYTILNDFPIITQISPLNNTYVNNGTIYFEFNISDQDIITNCSLTLDNEANKESIYNSTSSGIPKVPYFNILTAGLQSGNNHNYSITCCDELSKCNLTANYTFHIALPYSQEPSGTGLGGSGSSGGGSSGSRTEQETAVTGTNVILPYLAPAPLKIILDDPNLAVYEIIVEIAKETADVKVEIKEPTTIPVEKPGLEVFKYIEISSENLPNSFISEVYIKFKVPKSTVGDREINLYHYAEEWSKLPTKLISSDELFNYYESISPTLSYFAITLRDLKPLEKTSASQIKEFIGEKVKEIAKLTKKEIILYAIMPLIVVGLLCIFGIYKLIKFICKHRRIRNIIFIALPLIILFSIFVPLEKGILLYAVLPIAIIAILVYFAVHFVLNKIKKNPKKKLKS